MGALPRTVVVAVVVVLLGLGWLVVYAGGGTAYVWPHVFYVPVVLASIAFGIPGAALAGAAATILCGPLMPFDVASGEPQSAENWLPRGAFFVGIGVLSGAAQRSLQLIREFALAEQLEGEIERLLLPGGSATHDPAEASDRSAEELVRFMFEQEGAIAPVFQPIYLLGDGRLVAVEALTRFRSEPYEPPDVWFERAATVGLGVELELAAISRAFGAAESLPHDVTLSINCSPATIASPRLRELLDAHAGRRVFVEVTEHAVIEDYGALVGALAELRELGVEIAVDDAGAGFASLRHIVRLEPEIIKLDVTLTQKLRHDPVRRALADALVQFAQRTGSRMIAEGIEDEADLHAWREMGAYAAQGYLLGRPGDLPHPRRCDLLAVETGDRHLTYGS